MDIPPRVIISGQEAKQIHEIAKVKCPNLGLDYQMETYMLFPLLSDREGSRECVLNHLFEMENGEWLDKPEAEIQIASCAILDMAEAFWRECERHGFYQWENMLPYYIETILTGGDVVLVLIDEFENMFLDS